jgi:hypothetical protein
MIFGRTIIGSALVFKNEESVTQSQFNIDIFIILFLKNKKNGILLNVPTLLIGILHASDGLLQFI